MDLEGAFNSPEGNETIPLPSISEKIKDVYPELILFLGAGPSVPAKIPGVEKYTPSSIDPQVVDINVNIDGKKSSFSIPDVMNVHIESFKNPITKIHLPKGFIWKLAEAAKSKIMNISTPH